MSLRILTFECSCICWSQLVLSNYSEGWVNVSIQRCVRHKNNQQEQCFFLYVEPPDQPLPFDWLEAATEHNICPAFVVL